MKRTRLLTWVVFGLLASGPAAATSLSPEEERGRQIYFEGKSPRGEKITAYVGARATALPGAAATCASCHGADGRGRPEAGVLPSDITWDHLFKPYGHKHPMGRRHPAFTEDSLAVALRRGLDPAGQRLDTAMPTYDLSVADMADLLAYLRRLESDHDPGIADESLRIGTMLPTDGPLAAIGEGVRDVLTARFSEINDAGGIYGRRLVLVEAAYGAGLSPAAAAKRLLTEGDVVALLSPLAGAAESQLGELTEEHRVPTVGPLTLMSPDAGRLNDFTFYVLSGLREQIRVLADFAARELKANGIAISGPDDLVAPAETALRRQGRVHGWKPEFAIEQIGPAEDPIATAQRMAAAGVELLVFLGGSDLAALLSAGEEQGWRPWVLIPGAFANGGVFELPASFHQRVFLGYPTVPGDVSESGRAGLVKLLADHGAQPRHVASQITAMVATQLLQEGLQRAGRDLSRAKLLRALETVHGLETGLTPRLTFGPNRRVGALGAYVVSVDLNQRQLATVGGWRTPQ